MAAARNRLRTVRAALLLSVFPTCLLSPGAALAQEPVAGAAAESPFWNAVFYLSLAALAFFGVCAAYVVRKRIRKADRIRAALEHEMRIGREHSRPADPGGEAQGQDFSALRNVDSETGKVTYELHPVSHSRTEVGTSAYVVAVAGVAALLPVYGLPAVFAVLALAPLAARKFRPSLERVVGIRLILLAVVAAGIGALGSLLASVMHSGGCGAPRTAYEAAGQSSASQIPAYMPFVLLGALVFSVVLHESAHGLVAYWCGDPTAKNAGRLTLNPVKHFDFFGSFILPAILFFTTNIALGYAKPVPINISRFGRRPRDSIFAATAGATANFMIAGLSLGALVGVSFVMKCGWPEMNVGSFSDFLRAPEITGIPAAQAWSVLLQVLKCFFVVNIVLGILNLMPVPPLDGSVVLESLLPRNWRLYFRLVRVFGFVIIALVLALLMVSGAFEHILKLVMETSELIRFVTPFD